MTVGAQDADAEQLPDWPELTEAQQDRWTAVLGTLVETMVALAPTGDSDAGAAGAVGVGVGVAVEGICAAAVTDRLAQAFQRAAGRTCVRPASPGRGDLTVYLNSRHKREVGRDSDRDGNGAGGGGGGQRGRADVVIDLSDPRWPVIRRMAARLPALRSAVGPAGTVIAADLTPQMLEAARAAGRAGHSVLVLADAQSLPFADARIDTIIAAGLINHLHDLHGGLRELARVTRPGGQLVVFHPTGRAALAARHGRTLRPDEPLSERELPRHLAATGWRQTYYDDAPHRFLALASRE